jgi:outer membrane protein
MTTRETRKMAKSTAAALLWMGLCAISPSASAISWSDFTVTTGWFHIVPLSNSHPLQTQLAATPLKIPLDLDSPGTSSSVSNADTLAVTGVWQVGDHVAVEFVGGKPAKFEVHGKGTVLPAISPVNIDLGAPENNPLSTAKQKSPAITLQYRFRDAAADFRPFVGLGLNYTWYSGIHLDPDFENDLQRLGNVLAVSSLQPTPTQVSAKASSSFAPVAVAAFSYSLTRHFSLIGSVSLSWFKVTSTIRIDDADGNRVSTSKTEMDLYPVVTSLQVGNRF